MSGAPSVTAASSQPGSMPAPGGTQPSWLAKVLALALVGMGSVAIAAWLALALFHLGDRYKVGHVQGHWMALAHYANEGVLYPPLADNGWFGGTRHMPLAILVNAAASALSGEYLMSGKAIAIVLFGTLLVLTCVALRSLGCEWPLTVGLIGLVPATNTGLTAGSVPGGDVLSVVLQVSAVLLATYAVRSRRGGWLMAAGALAGLAAGSKLTGVWAGFAVLSWMALRRDWRRAAAFAAACASTAGATLLLVQWASQGRFLSTFFLLTFAGTGGPVGAMRAPNQLMFFALQDAPAVWMVAPLAVLGMLVAGSRAGFTVFHHALAWSLLLTLVVFTDMGAGYNQLLDLIVLTVVAIGWFAASLSRDAASPASLRTALALFIVWGGLTGVRGFVPDVREAVAIARGGELPAKYRPHPLSNVIQPGESLFAEDPGLPVSLGRRPVILDAFMLRRLAQARPDSVQTLVNRIRHREFEHVAMVVPLDEDDFWWEYYHLGLPIVTALRQQYVFAGRMDGYYVYTPRRPAQSRR